MTSLIEKLSRRPCLTIDEDHEISLLATLLKRYNVGCLVVTNIRSNFPSGIVSERDLVKNFDAICKGKISKVRDIMTKNIVYCDMKATSNEIMQKMTNKKIRHLPIIDNNELKGIVSIGDVVSRVISNYKKETEHLKNYISS